jgi:hypothetical protein
MKNSTANEDGAVARIDVSNWPKRIMPQKKICVLPARWV